MFNSLDSIEARFLELEKNLCDPGTFICRPRPPVPTWLFEIKSDDIKYEKTTAGCSSFAGISTSSIIEMTDPTVQPSPTTAPPGGDTTPLNSTDNPPLSSSSSALITKPPSPFVNTADPIQTTFVSEVLTSALENTTKDGGLSTGSATIVASVVISAVVVIFLIILVAVGCLRYHKKKKITPMSNGEPGNYLYSNQVKKRRWVSSGNPQVMAKRSMNGTTLVYDSPVLSQQGDDVENGEETVPSERQQNEINQSQTFTGIVMPNTDNVTMETDDALLQVKHKKRKKKKKRLAITVDSDGDNQNTESLPPRQLPPLTAVALPV